jgi:hypothetical protein
MEENVESKEEKKEEELTEEDKYSIRELRGMLGIPSDSIMFSFGR